MSEAPEQVAIPDSIEEGESNGLFCFLNADRSCGPDCMAFTTNVEYPQLSVQQRNCSLLVGVDRLARHAVIVAKLMNDARIDTLDRKRNEQKPPATPR